MATITTTVNSIDYIGVPLGYTEGSFSYEKEEAHIFLREKFNGNLVYSGAIYDYMLSLLIAGDFERQSIEVDKTSGVWEGVFSIKECEFDFNRCTVRVKPLPNDQYMPFIENGNKTYNVIDIAVAKTVVTPNYTYTRFRRLGDVIDYIINDIDSRTLSSNFLNDATNPITLLDNKYRHLYICQKSDFRRPNATEPVRVATITFNELMDILKNMLNLWWELEGSPVFRLEHYDFFTSSGVIDIRGQQISNNSMVIAFNDSRNIKTELFEMMEGGEGETNNIDFRKLQITYPLTSGDQEINRKLPVTTDVQMMEDETSLIDDAGWVIVACQSDAPTRYIFSSKGIISDTFKLNNDLSTANLMRSFFRYGMQSPKFVFIASTLDAYTVAPDKIQDIAFVNCDGIEPKKYYQTQAGDILGVNGQVLGANISTKSQAGNLSLGYSYTPVAPVPVPPEDDFVTITEIEPARTELFEIRGALSNLSPVGGVEITVTYIRYDSSEGGLEAAQAGGTWTIIEGKMADTYLVTVGMPIAHEHYVKYFYVMVTADWACKASSEFILI